jgi:hypothetical protein
MKTTTWHKFVDAVKAEHKKASKLRGKLLFVLDKNVSSYVHDLLWEDAKVHVFEQVLEATNPKTKSKNVSVETIRDYALERLLAMAMGRHASREQMAAWAIIINLSKSYE